MDTLSSLPFVDLYVCLKGDQPPHLRTSMKGLKKHPDIAVPKEYHEEIARLAELINKSPQNDMVMFDFGGMRLRAAFVETSNGEKWAALRKVRDLPPPITKLGIPPHLLPHLRAAGRRSGLILICGATGQGKTTTCCSLLVDYMENYGGVAFTIEDPVEYNLAGRRGDSGYCFQVEVREEHEWAEQLRKSLRCHPKYIFLGEVSSPDVANQLLRAATSGHLVIATVHAGSLQEGLDGILQLAEQAIGNRGRQLLASSLLAVVYQSLSQVGLTMTSLVTDYGNQGHAIRSLIRDSQIGQIVSFIDKQQAQMMQGMFQPSQD